MRAVYVFVYGTLLPGESNYAVAAPFVLNAYPGKVRGVLYDTGPYPAMVAADEERERSAGTEEFVRGMWLEIEERGLKQLDLLEDYNGPEGPNEYERIWISDASGGLKGWVYVWNNARGLPVIPEGCWRTYRARQHL